MAASEMDATSSPPPPEEDREDGGHRDQVWMLAEFIRSLSVANVYVGRLAGEEPSSSGDRIEEVRCGEREVTAKLDDGTVLGVALRREQDGVRFLPATCTGFRASAAAAGFLFRIHVADDVHVEAAENDDHLLSDAFQRHLRIGDGGDDIRGRRGGRCAACGQEVMVASSWIRKTVPLYSSLGLPPSTDWEQAMMTHMTYFCHCNHGDGDEDEDSTVETTSSFYPQKDEMFVCAAYVVVNASVLDFAKVQFRPSEMDDDDDDGVRGRQLDRRVLVCGRCHMELGETTLGYRTPPNDDNDGAAGSGGLKLYADAVVFSDRQLPVDVDPIQKTISRLIAEILETSRRASISWGHHDEGSDGPRLLLWIMDPHLRTMRARMTPAAVALAAGQNRREHSHAALRTVCKVLYRIVRSNSDDDDDDGPWKKGVGVHHVRIHRGLFLRLLDALIASTQSLPSAWRCATSDFFVAYIVDDNSS